MAAARIPSKSLEQQTLLVPLVHPIWMFVLIAFFLAITFIHLP
jgi:hypothetical protein